MNETTILIDYKGYIYPSFARKSSQEQPITEIKSIIRQELLLRILDLGNKYKTNKFVFCLEGGGKSKRKELYPPYKVKRHTTELTQEELARLKEFEYQADKMSAELENIGFTNVLKAEGLEADDVMASIAQSDTGKYVLVTQDADLYQCIKKNVSIYNPRTDMVLNYRNFEEQFGIPASRWWEVKALAGCSSDFVEGVRGFTDKGVAKTAVKYLTGNLKDTTKAYIKAEEEGKAIVERNTPLVKLPFEGTPKFELKPNKFNKKVFMSLCEEYGLHNHITDEGLLDWKQFFTRGSSKTSRSKPHKLKRSRSI